MCAVSFCRDQDMCMTQMTDACDMHAFDNSQRLPFILAGAKYSCECARCMLLCCCVQGGQDLDPHPYGGQDLDPYPYAYPSPPSLVEKRVKKPLLGQATAMNDP
jgi:hypothetical protein